MAEQLILALKSALTDYKIKVLLVDDQPIVGAQVKNMLADDKDIELTFVNDPTKALETAIELQPTLILQDLVLPDIDGLALVKFYRAHSNLKDTPIIVLSSKEDAETKVESFVAGANDYIVKLPDKLELIARIRYHSTSYINLLQKNDAMSKLEITQSALKSELDKASQYVFSLLPEHINDNRIETIYRFEPSAQLGGDIFGYTFIDDNSMAIYLLDVCGHGVGSALMSVSAQNVLDNHSLPGVDFREPEQVATALNRQFQMSKHNELYFTLWYGVLDFSTKKLKYVAAGHPPAFLYDAEKKTQLDNRNFVIGGIPEFPFSQTEIDISSPAKIYIYSDGCYEIALDDGTMWTIDGLFEFFEKNGTDDISDIDALLQYIQKLSGKEVLDDDFSVLKILIK